MAGLAVFLAALLSALLASGVLLRFLLVVLFAPRVVVDNPLEIIGRCPAVDDSRYGDKHFLRITWSRVSNDPGHQEPLSHIVIRVILLQKTHVMCEMGGAFVLCWAISVR